MLANHQKLKLVGFAVAIFMSYTAFGLLQEKIFKGRYGEIKLVTDAEVGNGNFNETISSGERFAFPVSFVAVQCIVYCLFAKGLFNKFCDKNWKFQLFNLRGDDRSRSGKKRNQSKVFLVHRDLLRYGDGDIEHGAEMGFVSVAGRSKM